jgi:uncharacterized repeat protein (TIGR02543 family)
VTLDALGNPDAIFIFQIAGDLTMASNQSVILSGGAQAKNIFWQVGGGAGAVIDTDSHFEGIILTATAIHLRTRASFNGKLLAQTAVTLDQNNIMDANLIDPPQVVLEIVSAHGIADWPVGVYTNAYGTPLTNTVTGVETIGGTQYVNVGWAMVGNDPVACATNYMDMVHTNDAVLTWLWNTNYLLNASATLGGTVTGSTNGFYAAGSNVTVTAVPASGYTFTGWTGDVSGPTNAATLNLTMDQARTVVAHFAVAQLTLEIISEHGVGTPPVGIYTNAYGTLLRTSVTGTETIGGTQYVNVGWTMVGNAPVAGAASFMITVQTNNAVLTWLWGTNYLLNASAGPGGAVTGSPNGFYPAGSNVTVTAVPASGYTFTGWTGDVSGPTNAATQNLTMDQARTLVAHFTAGQLTLEIVSAHGVGTPPVGVYVHTYGSSLANSVTAVQTVGGTQYVNVGWTMVGNGPVAGAANSMFMVLTNNAVLTWMWGTNYLLNASADPGGAVTGSPNGFYAAGSSVTVTAVPDLGYLFVGWTGDVSGPTNAATQNLTMDQARTLVAHFALDEPGCGTPVTQGAFMELDLSAMFVGAGWTYNAMSTLPDVMSAAITPEGKLRLEALAPGVTRITVNAVGAEGSESHSFPVAVVGHPTVLRMEMMPHEPWNPRFEQRIVVRNDTGIDCPAIGLRLLFSDIQPGIVIENQTGLTPSPDGRPMMEWSTLFPNGATQEIGVVYLATGAFRPDQYPPTVEVQYILSNVPLAPEQEGGPNIESIRVLEDGRVVIEFASVPGHDYEIDHAPTAVGPWQTVPLLLHAGANRTQWIDYGPPVTPPLTDARFYRVREVQQ